MYKGTYLLADLPIEIESLFEEVHTLCRDYATTGEAHFVVRTTPADIEEERRQSALTRQEEGLPPYEFGDSYLETLAVYRKIAEQAIRHGRLLMHGSVISVDGKAVMFTAKSGTGKSTHTRLWRELFGSRAVMVNDDKPLLRVSEEQTIVYGTPWDGKHRLSNNICAPLEAICILTRGKENTIREIRPSDALEMLLKQTYHPSDPLQLLDLLTLLDMLTKRVRFYLLACNMNPEAAVVAARGMGFIN